jgi:hypothetical protein
MFQHGIERAGYIEAPADPDLAFEFLRPVRRKVLHYGVQYQGRRYNGPALNAYRDKDSPYQNDSKRLWYIHVNPDDVTRVYFRDPFDRTWHTLWWEHAPALDMPMSEDAVAYARRLASARGAPCDPLAAIKGLLDRWNLGMGNSLTERRIALRLAREQAELFGELSTDDAASTLASLEAHRAALSTEAPSGTDESPAGATEPDDDLDEFAEFDDADETDDDFYADAFEDE